MKLKINRNEKEVIVKVLGRLDTVASADFATAMDPYMSESDLAFQIDCAEMEYIASSGLRTFLSLYKAITASGGEMSLTNVPPAIMQVLKMTGFSNFIKVQ